MTNPAMVRMFPLRMLSFLEIGRYVTVQTNIRPEMEPVVNYSFGVFFQEMVAEKTGKPRDRSQWRKVTRPGSADDPRARFP